MTIARFPVPPIVKRVTVRAAPARAFALFAGDFARWWPLSDGHETAWGTVLAYDPPHRLTFSWIVELPAGHEQLVEIRFTPEDRGTTVELTYSGWEQLGDAAASLQRTL